MPSIILLATVITIAAAEEQRPVAPAGFAWQDMKAINGAVLVPEGWHFSEMSAKGTQVYRVTPEKPNADGKPFRTGLTINVVKDVKKKSNAPPTIYAAKYMLDYIKAAKSATEPKIDKVGKLERSTCFVIKKMPEVDPNVEFRLRLTILANDETGTLYVVIFGTPQTEWDANYELGKKLFNPILLDQSI